MRILCPSPRVLALSLAAGLALAVSVVSAQTIKIGVAGPTTGPVTQYGQMVREGIDTAIERINAAGGVDGKQLEAVLFDDGCEPKQGPVVANRVVNQQIGFVVGHVCSGATIAAADVYDNEGVIMVTPSATAPALTNGKNYQYILRTIGRDDQQSPAAAQYIIESVKPKKVAVLHDKQSYGQGIATAVRDGLQQGNINIVMFEGINVGDNDYSAVVTKMRGADVDFVYYGGYHPELGLLMRQAREQGLQAKFMGPEGAGNPDINAIAGDAAEGMLLTLPADFSRNPANAAIVKAFNDKKRNASGAFQLTSYAAMQVIVESIQGAKSTNPEKVLKFMRANTFETPIGKVSWNKQGDLNTFEFQVFTWHKDGSKTPAK
jgi:branched-chain amino acid transport system substrate-binding protein